MKGKNVFKKTSKNDFIIEFNNIFKILLTEKKGEVLYAGVMLKDLLANKYEMPEYDTLNSEVYYNQESKSFLELEFNNVLNDLNRKKLKSLNAILFEDLNSTYLGSSIFLFFSALKPCISIDDNIFEFNEINLSKILNKNLHSEYKQKIKEPFKKHYDLIQKMNRKYSNNHYFSFIPITYKFLKNRILLYLTISGHFSKTENILKKDYTLDYKKKLRQPIFKLLIDQINYFGNKFKNEAFKSSISSIMSRNMSHNLGSHILSIVKQEVKNNAESQGYINGISHLLNYLQERQDYIATISGFINQVYIPMNFKETVFDGFLPDKKYERHQDSFADHVNLILMNIGKSENYNRENIDVVFGEFDGTIKKIETDSFKILEKLNINLPAGIIGRQAVFSILENFIRNSLKHSKKQERVIIKFNTPDLSIGEDSVLKFVENGNYDDEKRKILEYSPDDYIKFTLEDNLGNYSTAKEDIENGLKDLLIDQSGKLNPMYKGIKEMKISAAWLRGITHDELENGMISPPILQLQKSEDNSIRYIFYLRKSKELLIVLSKKNFNEIEEKKIERLKNVGIDIIEENKKFNSDYFQHYLNVIDNDVIDKTYFENRINQRILNIDFNNIDDIIKSLSLEDIENSKDVEDTISQFWKMRNKYLFNSNDYSIYIWDNESKQEQLKVINPCNRFCLIDENLIFKNTEHNKAERLNKKDIKILLKNHNDNLEKEFNDFKISNKSLFNNLEFLEGISGGNSTELIYRKLKKTNLLYYKIVESALTKVLIIDERLWNNNSEKSITELLQTNRSENDLRNILEKIKDESGNEWEKQFLEIVKCNDKKLLIELKDIRNEPDKIITRINPLIINNNRNKIIKEKDNLKWHLYNKKGIEILNIVLDFEEEKALFININNEEKAMFDCNGEKGRLIINGYSDDYIRKTNVVCIHQGIIDKIHDKFKKISVNEIFNEITNKFQDSIKIVHSGRSKPPELSEKAIFIPYASLEYAFYDSKFSLTNILYGAKNEIGENDG